MTSRSQRGIRFASPCDRGGYAVAARRLLAGLLRAQVPVTWTPMVPGSAWSLWYEPFTGSSVGDPLLDPICNRDLACSTTVVHLMPEYLVRWRSRHPEDHLVSHMAWESDRLPHHWAVYLENADRICVSCEWNRRVVAERNLSAPVHTLPHIVPDEPSSGPLAREANSDEFVFYCLDAWNARKAPWKVVRAFLSAFSDRDAVRLVLKTSRADATRKPWIRTSHPVRQALRRLLAARRHPPRVEVVDEPWSDEQITALHRRGDCYVTLSHGEAWHLGAFDAIANGTPVIAPRCGGPLDYLPADWPYWVEGQPVPVEDFLDRPNFLPDQHWTEASETHAARLMREVYETRRAAAERAAAVAVQVRERFSAERVVAQFVHLLDSP